jgi:hypothetical protein
MPKPQQPGAKGQRLMGLMYKIAFRSLKSKCECEVCLLGRQVADLLEDQLSSGTPKVIAEKETPQVEG